MNIRSQPVSSDPIVGLGPTSPKFVVYLPHSPQCDHLKSLAELRPAFEGELHQIGVETGNHWRKIINIAAKLGFAIQDNSYPTWQAYRDEFLCRERSDIALLFGATQLLPGSGSIHLVSGHQYCGELCSQFSFETLDADFRFCENHCVFDCPYFDYRQLSNIKLERLREYMKRQQLITC